MTDTDKKSIEDELVLREKVLAYKKKKQELNAETWHRVLKFLVLIFTIALCTAVVHKSFDCWDKTKEHIISAIVLILSILASLATAAFVASRLLRPRED